MEYTKGEWKPSGNTNGDMGVWSKSEPVCFLPSWQERSTLASVHDCNTRQANARLISAAPEMYEACKKLAAWDASYDDAKLISEACSLARLAIRKAEGK